MNKIKTVLIILAFTIITILLSRINNKISYTVFVENKSNSAYKIEILKPNFKNNKINNKIKEFITEEKNSFLKTVEENSDIKMFSELFIDFEVIPTNNLLNIKINSYSYTGGSHGNANSIIITYDAKRNKYLEVDDFFSNEFLEHLSNLTKSEITKDKSGVFFDENMIGDSLNPTNDNFNLFIFHEKTFEVLFPQYQIAPWSSGVIRLEFNYHDFEKYINKKNFDKYFKLSAESIDDSIVEIPQKEEITSNTDKVIALTFDDGPNPSTTNRLLDELKKRNIKATFFVLGNRVELFPETLKRISDEDHTIGIHTFSHKNLTKLTEYEISNEIQKTNKSIQDITGSKSNFLRPPYGMFNDKVINTANMPIILWNIDTLDWKEKDVDKISNNLINNIKTGNIVLAHDLYDKTIDGIIKAVDILIKDGYKFVSLEEYEKIFKVSFSNKAYYSLPKKSS